jgi:hypothetical protein
MKQIALALCFLLQLMSCNATEPSAFGPAKEPSHMDLWNKLVEDAQKATGVIRDYGQPRSVKHGATPEIILSRENIRFNGRPLRLGASIDEWYEILGRNHRDYPYFNTSTWDDLGIILVMDSVDKKTVIQISIYVNLEPKDPYAGSVTHRPDGTPVKPTYDSKPKKPFSGYLELDGVGIDAKTKLWEIRKQVGADRNITCNLDCSHPLGHFSDSADLFMRLNSGNESGEIYEFGIGGQAKGLRAALRARK